ncbi:hypothetical protein HYFRA_00008308 [Hymenoscyphus fraxineus]|uniref:Uncharacterized protein n=1 Tax=Hymenoscyphus fraxineus TaxID=746836 RepID=A0A9N9PNK1_9HELO|nr:hypothetical protein HYFRA_00014209 [Hymenoscyphus fraxineus]CAG8949451.1 hypothetical protein HYFRA_00014224 [Hymenoscyphus fraxineus]CAG8950075.1 hypothetical protein HYFRA_00008308 [Hymenoscyphus fraxineus]
MDSITTASNGSTKDASGMTHVSAVVDGFGLWLLMVMVLALVEVGGDAILCIQRDFPMSGIRWIFFNQAYVYTKYM